MKYYLKEEFLHDNNVKNAGNKARNDVEVILNKLGYSPLKVLVKDWYQMNVLNAQIHKYRAHSKAFKFLNKNDEIVIQFPLLHHTLFLSNLLRKLKNKGVKVYFLIHDLETLRFVNDKTLPFRMKLRMKLTESDTFRNVTGIIAHNPIMKSVLVDKGVVEDKIVSLGIFDYLIPDFQEKSGQTKDQPIIVAGNLAKEKAGYLYTLPEAPSYNLYGVGFDESRALANETYFGSFLPDELPAALEGGFGLVWGNSENPEDERDYYKENISYKLSTYLSAGLPVVVPDYLSNADYIREKGLGFVASSLEEANRLVQDCTEEEYAQMVRKAQYTSYLIRNGYFTKKLFVDTIMALGE